MTNEEIRQSAAKQGAEDYNRAIGYIQGVLAEAAIDLAPAVTNATQVANDLNVRMNQVNAGTRSFLIRPYFFEITPELRTAITSLPEFNIDLRDKAGKIVPADLVDQAMSFFSSTNSTTIDKRLMPYKDELVSTREAQLKVFRDRIMYAADGLSGKAGDGLSTVDFMHSVSRAISRIEGTQGQFDSPIEAKLATYIYDGTAERSLYEGGRTLNEYIDNRPEDPSAQPSYFRELYDMADEYAHRAENLAKALESRKLSITISETWYAQNRFDKYLESANLGNLCSLYDIIELDSRNGYNGIDQGLSINGRYLNDTQLQELRKAARDAINDSSKLVSSALSSAGAKSTDFESDANKLTYEGFAKRYLNGEVGAYLKSNGTTLTQELESIQGNSVESKISTLESNVGKFIESRNQQVADLTARLGDIGDILSTDKQQGKAQLWNGTSDDDVVAITNLAAKLETEFPGIKDAIGTLNPNHTQKDVIALDAAIKDAYAEKQNEAFGEVTPKERETVLGALKRVVDVDDTKLIPPTTPAPAVTEAKVRN